MGWPRRSRRMRTARDLVLQEGGDLFCVFAGLFLSIGTTWGSDEQMWLPGRHKPASPCPHFVATRALCSKQATRSKNKRSTPLAPCCTQEVHVTCVCRFYTKYQLLFVIVTNYSYLSVINMLWKKTLLMKLGEQYRIATFKICMTITRNTMRG